MGPSCLTTRLSGPAHMLGAPSSQWIACSAARNSGGGRPLNWVVRHQPVMRGVLRILGIIAVVLGSNQSYALCMDPTTQEYRYPNVDEEKREAYVIVIGTVIAAKPARSPLRGW